MTESPRFVQSADALARFMMAQPTRPIYTGIFLFRIFPRPIQLRSNLLSPSASSAPLLAHSSSVPVLVASLLVAYAPRASPSPASFGKASRASVDAAAVPLSSPPPSSLVGVALRLRRGRAAPPLALTVPLPPLQSPSPLESPSPLPPSALSSLLRLRLASGRHPWP